MRVRPLIEALEVLIEKVELEDRAQALVLFGTAKAAIDHWLQTTANDPDRVRFVTVGNLSGFLAYFSEAVMPEDGSSGGAKALKNAKDCLISARAPLGPEH